MLSSLRLWTRIAISNVLRFETYEQLECERPGFWDVVAEYFTHE